MMLSSTSFEQKSIKRRCNGATGSEIWTELSLALWHYAGALYMTGREDAR